MPASLAPAPQAGTYEQCFQSAYTDANRALRRITSIDCDLSGSTGISALVASGTITVANLGDSRCVLGEQWFQV